FCRWMLLPANLVLVVVLGFCLPPVRIVLMAAPIILPGLEAPAFDLVGFGGVIAVVMEMRLTHRPGELNIFVINALAPDVPLSEVIWAVLPVVSLMAIAVVVLCFAPEIAAWLPDKVITTTR